MTRYKFGEILVSVGRKVFSTYYDEIADICVPAENMELLMIFWLFGSDSHI